MKIDDEVRAIAKVIDRLSERFLDVPRPTIEQAVRERHRIFDGRPVRDFVPLLVEREVKGWLLDSRTRATHPPAPGPGSTGAAGPGEFD